jgi:hypothetical protein
MATLREDALELLEAELGSKISYETISPSIFMFLEVRQAAIHSQEDEPLVEIERLRVHYNLIRLLFGDDPIAAISRIDISGTGFKVDWEQDRELAKIFDRTSPFSSSRLSQIVLTGSDLSFDVSFSNYRIVAEKLSFRLQSRREGWELVTRKGVVSMTAPGLPGVIRTDMRLRSVFSKDFSWQEGWLKLRHLSSPYLAVTEQVFELSRNGSQIVISRRPDRLPLSIDVTWDPERGSLDVDFESQAFRLSDGVTSLGTWSLLKDWLDVSLTSSGRLTYKAGDNNLAYTARVTASIPQNRFVADAATLTCSLSGSGRSLTFKPLFIKSSQGAVYFSGDLSLVSYLPRGHLQLLGLKIQEASVDTALKIDRTPKGLNIRGEKLLFGDAVFKDIVADLTPDGGGASFRLQARFPPSPSAGPKGTYGVALPAVLQPAPKDGSVRLQGKISFKDTVELLATGDLAALPLDSLLRVAPSVPGLSASGLRLSSRLFLQTDFSNWSVDSPSVSVWRDDSMELRRESGADAPNGFLGSLLKDLSLNGSAFFRTKTNGDSSLKLSLYQRGVLYDLELGYQPDSGFILRGNHGLSGRVTAERWGYSFDLSSGKLPIPLSESSLYATLDIHGSFQRAKGWTVLSSGSSLHDIPFLRSKRNELAFNFLFHNSYLYLPEISYRDEYSFLLGEGSAEISSGVGFSAHVLLEAPDGQERYEASLSRADGDISAEAVLLHAPLPRLIGFLEGGNVNARVLAGGSPDNPEIELFLDLEGARWGRDPLSLSLAALYTDQRLRLSSLAGRYRDYSIVSHQGWYDRHEGDFYFAAEGLFDYFGAPAAADLSVMGSVSPQEGGGSSGEGPYAGGLSAEAELFNLRAGRKTFPSWSLSLHTENDRLLFSGGPEGSIAGSLSSSGQFSLDLQEPLSVKVAAEGKIEGNKIDARLSNLDIDLSLLSLMFGGQIVGFHQGHARGNLSVTGLLNDPDFFGDLDASGIIVSFYMAPDSTDPFDAILRLEEKTLWLERATARMGPAIMSAQGSFGITHWIPDTLDLMFRSESSAGLHMIHDFGWVNVDGYASGELRAWGSFSRVNVSGDVKVDYCNVTIRQIERHGQPSGVELFVDLNLLSGRQVEFLWPTVTFPVVRAHSRPGSSLAVAYSSDAANTTIRGDIALIGGEVFYFDRSFYLKEGAIIFNDTLAAFDPRLSLQAEIRERDDQDEDVKIYLVVDESRLSQFSPRFTSIPAKTDLEIVALLGGPLQDQFEESGFGLSALLLSTDVLSRFGILRPFEQNVREALGLDLFSIRTRVLQNLLFSKVLGVEEPTDAGSGSLGRYLDNTTITFGKYLGNDLFLEALLRFQEGGSFGLTTDFMISLEWPTPFFDLEWVLNPKIHNLNELFLPDNSLILRWRYSY